MFGENFWVDASLRSIPDGSKVVFADVRFPNQADTFRELGGKVWRINRIGFNAANDHISEHALDEYKFDLVVDNNYSIEYIYHKVETLINK
jgi:hypothetical protein